MSNARFKANFAKVLERAGNNAQEVVRNSGMEVLRRLIRMSPVGDPSQWADPDSAPPGYVGGRFRNNWQIAVGAINKDISAPPDRSGGGSLQRGQGIIASLPVGATFYITNSLPYARTLEYGRENGKPGSYQAPGGMVRITVREFNQIIRQVAASIK